MANYGMEEPRKRNVRAEMNITPMVDIVFTLLIIFMVAVPLIEQQGVDLDLPQTETVPIKSKEDKFIVWVYSGKKESENKIIIGDAKNDPVHLKNLEVKLKTNAVVQEKKEIYLYASHDLSYGYVVRIMAIMKNAGIDNINLVTEPLEKE